MRTIRYFKVRKFEGSDASLATSLFEYRLIWRQLTRNSRRLRDDPSNYQVGEWEFVAPCLHRPGWYHHSYFKPDLDVYREFNWVRPEEWYCFYETNGTTKADWDQLPLSQKIYDLISYFGQENILGDDYGRGYPVQAS